MVTRFTNSRTDDLHSFDAEAPGRIRTDKRDRAAPPRFELRLKRSERFVLPLHYRALLSFRFKAIHANMDFRANSVFSPFELPIHLWRVRDSNSRTLRELFYRQSALAACITRHCLISVGIPNRLVPLCLYAPRATLTNQRQQAGTHHYTIFVSCVPWTGVEPASASLKGWGLRQLVYHDIVYFSRPA